MGSIGPLVHLPLTRTKDSMSTELRRYISPGEYLQGERLAKFKSEYFDGVVFATAGASRRHNLVSLNTASSLNAQLADQDCEVYANDLRVCISPTGLYTYP